MKRLFDVITAFLLLLLFSPVLIIAMLLVKIFIGSPIFFFQSRPGYQEKIFKIIKLRTMTNKCDETGKLLPDEKRLTKLGKLLRKSSIDELPQLINVILGDLSLVGPRPLLVEYLPLYNERQRKRHLVRPGITGWSQVNGRNNLSWQKKFELDVWYVENHNFILDIKILLITVKKTFYRSDICFNENGSVIKFEGTPNE
jgi:lipopolysaccharide/colanic/teichoic acid biosynthesis glycosyltransferase